MKPSDDDEPLVFLPAMRVWLRDALGLLTCPTCDGRRAWICEACQGEGGRDCDMDHWHDCSACYGVGFRECKQCTERIEYEEIPQPLVRVAGATVSAWTLVDALKRIPPVVARVSRVHHDLRIRAGKAEWLVPGSLEARLLRDRRLSAHEFPLSQCVLPFEAA